MSINKEEKAAVALNKPDLNETQLETEVLDVWARPLGQDRNQIFALC